VRWSWRRREAAQVIDGVEEALVFVVVEQEQDEV
jgi:hypothetical protein